MRFPFLELPLSVRAAVLFFGLTWAPGIAPALTLAELFATADTLSPALADARLDLAQARADYQAARGMPNPTLFGEREHLADGAVEETELTYGLRQPLGHLWSYFPKRAAARSAYQSAQATYDEARRQLLVELADRALTVSALEQQRALLDTVLVHTRRAVQAMEDRFRLGDVSEYDLHRLQAEMLRLQQTRFALLKERQEAGAEFTNLSGLSDGVLLDFTLEAMPPVEFTTTEQAVAAALRQWPFLQARTAATAAAERAYAASRWNQWPDLTVGVGRKSVEPGFTGVALEAELELPIFTQRRGERTLAHTAWTQAQLQAQAARVQSEQDARAAFERWRALTTDEASPASFDATQARRDLDRGMQMYLQGELSPVEVVDLLRSTLESLDASLQLANARVLAELDLRRVTGLPLLEQHP